MRGSGGHRTRSLPRLARQRDDDGRVGGRPRRWLAAAREESYCHEEEVSRCERRLVRGSPLLLLVCRRLRDGPYVFPTRKKIPQKIKEEKKSTPNACAFSVILVRVRGSVYNKRQRSWFAFWFEARAKKQDRDRDDLTRCPSGDRLLVERAETIATTSRRFRRRGWRPRSGTTSFAGYAPLTMPSKWIYSARRARIVNSSTKYKLAYPSK